MEHRWFCPVVSGEDPGWRTTLEGSMEGQGARGAEVRRDEVFSMLRKI